MTKDEFLEFNATTTATIDTVIDVKCEHCGKIHGRKLKGLRTTFLNRGMLATYCSETCRRAVVDADKWAVVSCENCGIEVRRRKNEILSHVFCGHSCSAQYGNKGRVPSESQRAKVSKTLRDKYHGPSTLNSTRGKYKNCVACNKKFLTPIEEKIHCSEECKVGGPVKRKKNKEPTEEPPFCKLEIITCPECKKLTTKSKKIQANFCSTACRKANVGRRMSEWLSRPENRTNLGRGKRSYMESSFDEWLRQHNIKFEAEVRFRNEELERYYYVDFLFSDLNLVIELDGTQHLKTVEEDAIRDDYLRRVHGLTVVRIKHKEYVKQTRVSEIKQLLGIP